MNEASENRKGFDEITSGLSRCTCPCCGYPTLEERNSYDICELCNWEDDGQDDDDASVVRGGPNGSYSLSDARANFRRYRIMYSPENNTTITGPDSQEREDLKIRLMNTFDGMLSNPVDSAALWKEVEEIEKLLYEELSKSIEGYEKSHTYKP